MAKSQNMVYDSIKPALLVEKGASHAARAHLHAHFSNGANFPIGKLFDHLFHVDHRKILIDINIYRCGIGKPDIN